MCGGVEGSRSVVDVRVASARRYARTGVGVGWRVRGGEGIEDMCLVFWVGLVGDLLSGEARKRAQKTLTNPAASITNSTHTQRRKEMSATTQLYFSMFKWTTAIMGSGYLLLHFIVPTPEQFIARLPPAEQQAAREKQKNRERENALLFETLKQNVRENKRVWEVKGAKKVTIDE